MRVLLLFFIGVSCIDTSGRSTEKSSDNDDDDDRREGDRQGDCVDGEDNDNDGDIDCTDSGCSSKPICEGEDSTDPDLDTDSDTDINPQDFSYTAVRTFDIIAEDSGWEQYENCTITWQGSYSGPAPQSCSDCDIEAQFTSTCSDTCSWVDCEAGTISWGIDLDQEKLYGYDQDSESWYENYDSTYCNEERTVASDQSSFDLTCSVLSGSEYYVFDTLSFTW